MTDFHYFPRLPAELRMMIWEMTAEPRTVEVRAEYEDEYTGTVPSRMFSSTPVPAILQTCRESRNLGLYEKAFQNESPLLGTNRRYIWVNLEVDMVDIGTTYFDYFRKVASTLSVAVKRLKFARTCDEYFFYNECVGIINFINVKEIHVVCLDGFAPWSAVQHSTAWTCGFENAEWPCGFEKVFFIDPAVGRIIPGSELANVLDE